MKPRFTALALATFAVACTDAGGPSSVTAPAAAPPEHLRDTGLDADGVLPFSPQYPLWTDGATKRRWIWLPPGTSIDASDPDAWVFPAGTKLWKEFAFDRPVETRLAERLPDGTWRYAAYVWDADGTDAVLAPRGARVELAALGAGRRHDVPAAGDCLLCHDTRRTPVLGFSTLQLSPDRDPGAPHAEPPPPGAVDLASLAASGRLVNLPAALLATPPRIAARTPTERAALGYLHGNCGACHDATGELAELAMNLRHDAIATTVGKASRAPLPHDPAAPRVRIAAGDPDASVLLGRMGSRAPAHQMPPLGTLVVDDDALALVTRWIAELEPQPDRRRP